MKLQFTKMHGAGNDFIVLDGIHQKLDLTDAFEEAAGKGRDAQLGLMAKNRRGRPPHARAHAPAVRCGAHLWQLSSRPRLRSPRAGLRRRWA